jgi:hypothetical protein
MTGACEGDTAYSVYLLSHEVTMFQYKCFVCRVLSVLLFSGVTTAGAVSVAPITSGAFPLGSTNFEVTSFTTAEMQRRLIGSYTSTTETYISDILLHAAD